MSYTEHINLLQNDYIKQKGIEMPRFFVPKEKIDDKRIVIDSEDVAHITRVLRLGIGDKLTVCDGRGYDYNAEISEISKKEIICEILEKNNSETEANISVTLFQGIPKGSKMEYIIQKTTEMGITDIVPVSMTRCVSKVEDRKSEQKKLERWQKIAVEASKQSQRGIVPKIHNILSFKDAILKMKEADLYFAPYECEEDNKLRNVLKSKQNIQTAAFMIGPEGGYDLMEIEKLKEEKIPTVTLGKRILRTETAPLAVTAMLMYEIGDVNQD